MAWFSVGPSSYPDLKGQDQLTNSQRIADQFWSLVTDMQQYLPNGARLSANEARRTRARQVYLWDNRKALGIVVANPYTSRHDEVAHGNAIDVGMTLADGTNSALSAENFARMQTIAERRGFTWQGRYFGEPWHIEGATRKEILPPYPNARAVADAEFAKHSDNTTTAPVVVAPYFPDWSDTMMIRIIDHPKDEPMPVTGKGGIWLHNVENGKRAYIADPDVAKRVYRVLFPAAHDQMLQVELDQVTALVKQVL